ncbi:dimethylsulfonioproprionate lyase family protein [Paracoccus luteus]|uniref:dimethylsulfonioproprionate lyase family protein n=1 Tax=Paracoccus luteus TaxID=2508543 RepID=UPI00106F2A3C|nr:dimethylsulfonioproprionate lyase family protein [Paracoccus luteus]
MTDPRNPQLQGFLDAALGALERHAICDRARASLRRIAAASHRVEPHGRAPAARLPVCAHLDPLLASLADHPAVGPLAHAFRDVAPLLVWRTRADPDGTASRNFPTSHANAMFIGPGGIEPRSDIWIGVSLLAPHVRYPDHTHAPEETYLVLSDGEFRQGDGDWFSPGVGGSFYNPPGIWHTMRSGDTPLLALWALWNDGAGAA